MIKFNKRLIDVSSLFKDRYEQVAIECYFSKQVVNAGSDELEMKYSNETTGMRVINEAFIRELSAERLVYKQYGLKELGALEILCDARYTDWFKLATKIVVNNTEYEVYSDKLSNNGSLIQKRPFNMIRVTITKRSNG